MTPAPSNEEEPDTPETAAQTDPAATSASAKAAPTNTEPVEPETSVIIATDGKDENSYAVLDKSDDYVSLGEGKGSYKYTDGTLTLKDVNIELTNDSWAWTGLEIAHGSMVITLVGSNNIKTNNGHGIYVYDGNLTINGDGSLTITCTGYGDGIYVNNGSLTIDGAKVSINVESEGGYSAIATYNGDVNIINGADVTATTKVTGDYSVDPYAIYAYNGKITIKDSNVTAVADGRISLEGSRENWIVQKGVGLYSAASLYNPDMFGKAGIEIVNSNVHSTGNFASMLVSGRDGKITIADSTIVTPEGVNIRELMRTLENDPDAGAVQVGAILATGEGPIDLDAIMAEIDRLLQEGDDEALAAYLTSLFDQIAKDVTIVRDSELVTAEKSASLIPKTGDDGMNTVVLLLTLAASGCVCAYLIRRKVSA